MITSSSGTKFTLNVCGAVHTELWNPQDVKDETVGGFFRGEHGDFSIGYVYTSGTTHRIDTYRSLLHRSYATNVTIVNDEPYIFMKDGSLCPGSTMLRASTAIRFICDASVFSEGSPKVVAQLPPGGDSYSCAFFIEWRTPVRTAPSSAVAVADRCRIPGCLRHQVDNRDCWYSRRLFLAVCIVLYRIEVQVLMT